MQDEVNKMTNLAVVFLQIYDMMIWRRHCVTVFLGCGFSGLILEAPFNNLIEAASNHPLTAVCCRLYL